MDDAAPEVSSRRLHAGWRRWVTPTSVHVASLVLGLLALLWIGRDQWFFGDDWIVLSPRQDDNVLLPQNGHWKLAPALVFQAMRNWIGLGSYLPYLALAILAHLAVVHLIWRILKRVGAAPWIATLLACMVVVLGAGVENLMWAFQFGFMGAVALALLVVLLFDREKLNYPAIVVVALVAPTFSGTAIPVLGAAALVGLVRHGILRTLLPLIPAGVAYLAWYVTFAAGAPGTSSGPSSASEAGLAVAYALAMVAGGLGRAMPWIGLGVLPAIAVGLWFVLTVRRRFRSAALPAYALTVGTLAFAALTAYSRASFGLSSAGTSRYSYVTIVLLLPAIGILLTALAARSTTWRTVTLAAIGVLIATNLVFLLIGAHEQAIEEQAGRERILNALDALLADPDNQTLLDAKPDSEYSFDVNGADLLQLAEWGQLSR